MSEVLSIDSISDFLLNQKYLLTALELDFELIERGIENRALRNFFTNPENFEHVSAAPLENNFPRIRSSQSISTIDSIDFAKASDDGNQSTDEKIKVLEFELRKKNDEVKKLREELTLMFTCNVQKSDERALAHENRALNFLINEYLMRQGLKLTAVSFSEEIIDQDLDSWDDVGLNIPKLANLESLLRVQKNNQECNEEVRDTVDQLIQTDDWLDVEKEEMIAENSNLNKKVGQLNEQLISLQRQRDSDVQSMKEQNVQLSQLKKEAHEARNKLICIQRDLMQQQQQQQQAMDRNNKVWINNHQPSNVSGGSLSGVESDVRSESVSVASVDPTGSIVSGSGALPPVSDTANITTTSTTSAIISTGFDAADVDDVDGDADGHGHDGNDMPDMDVSQTDKNEPIRNPPIALQKLVELISSQPQITDNEDDVHNVTTTTNTTSRTIESICYSTALVESLDEMIVLISGMIPRLFAAVKDKENSDIVLLLVQSACLHPDSKAREKLLRLLIHLYTDPTEVQRQFVLRQIQLLAAYLGEYRVESELITQIWEMLYEKPRLNGNLRILLVNICGVIAPIAPVHLRGSLILSIQHQMLEEEPDPTIVGHILRSIASLVPHLYDESKVVSLLQLLGRYLWRSLPPAEDVALPPPPPSSISSQSGAGYFLNYTAAPAVTSANSISTTSKDADQRKLSNPGHVTAKLILPAVAQWALDCDKFHTGLLTDLLNSMDQHTFFNQNSPADLNHVGVAFHISLLTLLVPFIEVWLKKSIVRFLESVDMGREKVEDEDEDKEKVDDDEDDDVNRDQDKVDGAVVDTCSSKKRNQHRLNWDRSFPVDLVLDRDRYEQLNERFETLMQQTTVDTLGDCDELIWLRSEVLIRIIDILEKVVPRQSQLLLNDHKVISELAKNQFSTTSNKYQDMILQIGRFIYGLCSSLQLVSVSVHFVLSSFTDRLFQSHQQQSEKQQQQQQNVNKNKIDDASFVSTAVTNGILSGYCAVQAALNEYSEILSDHSLVPLLSNEVLVNLRRFLTNVMFVVAAENLPLDGVRMALAVLRDNSETVSFYINEIVLPSLQPCVTCPDISVRVLVCLILRDVIQLVSSDLPLDCYVALLATLKLLVQTDDQSKLTNMNSHQSSDDSVKVMCLGVAVSLLQVESRHISSVVHEQTLEFLATLMNEAVNFRTQLEITEVSSSQSCSEVYMTTLIQMVNIIGPVSSESYRNEVILPWLFAVTEINNATADNSRRSSVAMILYSTFSTLSYYLEAKAAFESFLLPSLDRLKLDMQELYPESVKEVELMSQEIRRRFEGRQKSTASSDVGQSVRSKLSNLAFMSKGGGASTNQSSLFSRFGGSHSNVNSNSGSNQAMDNNQESSAAAAASNNTVRSNLNIFFSKKR